MILKLRTPIDVEHVHSALGAFGFGGHSIRWGTDTAVLRWEEAPRSGVDWIDVQKRAQAVIDSAPSAEEGARRAQADRVAQHKVTMALRAKEAERLAALEPDPNVRAALLRMASLDTPT